MEDEIDDTKKKQPSTEPTCMAYPLNEFSDPISLQTSFKLQYKQDHSISLTQYIEFKAFTNTETATEEDAS